MCGAQETWIELSEGQVSGMFGAENNPGNGDLYSRLWRRVNGRQSVVMA